MTLAEKYAHGIWEARTKTQLTDHAFYLALQAALKKRNHEKLLPQILREYAKLAGRSTGAETIVRCAGKEDESAGLAKAQELGAAEAKIIRDSSLVRGYCVEGKNFRYDASARRSLINLYAKLTLPKS